LHDAHLPGHRSDDDATRLEAAAERGDATFSDANVPDDAEATMNEATAGDSAGADATVVLPDGPAGGRGDATMIEPDNSAARDRSPGELGAGPPSEAGTVANSTGTGGPDPEAQTIVLPGGSADAPGAWGGEAATVIEPMDGRSTNADATAYIPPGA